MSVLTIDQEKVFIPVLAAGRATPFVLRVLLFAGPAHPPAIAQNVLSHVIKTTMPSQTKRVLVHEE